MSYLKIIYLMLRRECLLSYRKRTEMLNPLLFFIMVAVLFPLAITPDPKVLQIIAPGILWVAVLLSTLLSLHKLFKDDYQDGSLEQLLLVPHPLSLLIFIKIFAYWLMQAVPIILVTPILAMMFHLPWHVIFILISSLLLGTPILSLLGAIGAALTVSLRNSSLLLALILLPLYVPALIFGASAVVSAEIGTSVVTQMAILGALLSLSVTLAPLTTAFALRIAVEMR